MSLSFPSDAHPLAGPISSTGAVADLKAAALAALILAVNYLGPLMSDRVSEAAPGSLGVM